MAVLVRGDGRIALGGGQVPLLVTNPSGHGLHLIARCPVTRPSCEIDAPTWSPDGTQLAFLRGHIVGRLVTSRMSLYVAAAKGTGPRRVARCDGCGDRLDGRLAWSPDSKWIAFSRAKRTGRRRLIWSIWVVAAAGGKPHRLCASCNGFDPVWSPNGRLIVFANASPGCACGGLYTVRPDGTRVRTIVKRGSDPARAPDGHRIVFNSGESIAVVKADGSHLQVLLRGPLGLGGGGPSWSPDGRKLAFLETPGRHPHFRFEIWTMNADGSGRERLYRSGCCVGSWAPPIWSPGGRMIAFIADSAHGTFVINADGTDLRRLSPIPFEDLSWQRTPKGER